MTEENVHRSIRELRIRLGMTQEEFAHAVAVTFSTVNRWENGHAKPSKLARRAIEALARRGNPRRHQNCVAATPTRRDEPPSLELSRCSIASRSNASRRAISLPRAGSFQLLSSSSAAS